ncbi:MAG: hypothetical protein HOV87_10400 [Catenulispora sp.]|nr:hypothetical protein [Catenulispora sp.]
MSNGPARVVNGRVVFGEAVTQAAQALNPIGAVGRILAETYALTAEMRRISLEKNQNAGDKEIALAVLEQRRQASSATIQNSRDLLGSSEVSLKALRKGVAAMQRELVKPGLSLEDRSLFADMTKTFTAQLLQRHKDQAGESTIPLDRLLNGPSAVALAQSLGRPDRERKSPSGERKKAEEQGTAPKNAKSKAKPSSQPKPKPESRDGGRARGRRS